LCARVRIDFEMGNRIYVGNLSYSTTDDVLREAFAKHGEVVSANVMLDRVSGQSRGFGFVEMATEDQAKTAIEAMHGFALDNRTLTVNEARAREPRAGGPGGGPGGGDGGRRPGRGGGGGGGPRKGGGGGNRGRRGGDESW
jgi:RNA recognition motif-containing protein